MGESNTMLRSRTVSHFFIFGISFTLLSIPFITGMLRPSFGERNPYALFYAFFELPVTLLFSRAIDSLAEAVWDTPAPDQIDLMQFFVSLAFWALLGATIGWIKDLRGNTA